MVRKSEQATAFHEAGHAVVTWYLGLSVRRASIVATEQHLGMVERYTTRLERRAEYERSPEVTARAESLIQISLAGPLAQRKAFPRSKWKLSGGSDFPKAAGLFGYISEQDDKAASLYWQLLLRRTEILVEFLWPEIDAVADELLRSKMIYWPQIKQICFDARDTTAVPAS